MSIYAAFVKAQKAFGPALKTSTNPHFKSRYADLSAVVEAVIDALNSNGIAVIQKSHPNESGVSIETVFIHESGESISSGILSVPAAKHDPQGFGSAMTYARRYSLMAACGIAPEDDDGNAASKPKKRSLNSRGSTPCVLHASSIRTGRRLLSQRLQRWGHVLTAHLSSNKRCWRRIDAKTHK
ncbi:MAG: ERF superfamily protein [Caulobacteraceae bacterium]|nr:ERF superfamily protein [Caulobacteraceae bacterium]